MRKTITAVLGVVLFVLSSVEANADEGFIGAGVRFAWNNSKDPIMVYDGMGQGAPGLSSLDYGGPKFGAAVHWGVTNQLVLTLAADFGYFHHTVYPYPETSSMHFRSSVKSEFYTIGGLLGVKYYFVDPEADRAVLYLAVGVGACFSGAGSTANVQDARHQVRLEWNEEYPNRDDNDFQDAIAGDSDYEDHWEDDWEDAEKADEDAQNVLDAQLEMVGDLASPLLFQAAFGIEFFATKGFSIGADIFGVRFAFASADVGKISGSDINTAAWTGDQRYINLFLYSAVTMNFNFYLGGTTSSAQEQQEDWVEPSGNTDWEQSDSSWDSPAATGQSTSSGTGSESDRWNTSDSWSTGEEVAPEPAPRKKSPPSGRAKRRKPRARPKAKPKAKPAPPKKKPPTDEPPPPPAEF